MKVSIKTPARLHLGLIDLRGELGRLYGGIGVAISCPNVILEAEESPIFTINGEKSEIVKHSVELFAKKYNVEPSVSISVKQVFPEHVGLGSGTQLKLAVATSLARILKIDASPEELAKAVGRGSVSGIGTAVFDTGGFVVESGVRIPKTDKATNFPPIIFHHNFPKDWVFVVAIPDVKQGLSGKREEDCCQSLKLVRGRVG